MTTNTLQRQARRHPEAFALSQQLQRYRWAQRQAQIDQGVPWYKLKYPDPSAEPPRRRTK